jgi:hypothetical protein
MGITQEQAYARSKFVGDSIGSLLASGKPVTLKDFQDTAATLVADHMYSVQDAAKVIADAAGTPPDQLTNLAKRYYAVA